MDNVWKMQLEFPDKPSVANGAKHFYEDEKTFEKWWEKRKDTLLRFDNSPRILVAYKINNKGCWEKIRTAKKSRT